MENRKRNIQMKFYVTEEEKRLIDEKMKQLPIKQYGAYFRKMAIDGYILVVDRSDTKAYIRELASGEPEHQPNCKTRQCDGDGLQAGYRGH